MLEGLRGKLMAAIEGWKGFEAAETPETRESNYDALWSLYDGSAFTAIAGSPTRRKGVFKDQRIYNKTRLVYSHVSSVGDFYATHVYQGNLPTDGKRLPDGSRGAIPLDPQTGEDATDEALLAAIAHSWGRCNWQGKMSIRPLFCSILGDGLTELVDDLDRHAVWPQFIWPGYVADFDLDSVDNLKFYALEYMVTQVHENKEETFRFRKEVDKEEYRYFKDDKPFTTYPGGAVQENPYGFVPAIWDRHKQTRGNRGLSAIANTRQALYELNSTLSHGMDYQRKAFAAPILIKGSMGGTTKDVIKPDPETVNFKEVSETGGIEQLTFDIEDSLKTIEWTKQGILEGNPEASFYHELRQMSTLTGPAASRALGDATSRVDMARKGYDSQSVKLFQMQIAMLGYRLNNGDWSDVSERDKVYAPFNLDSYKAGQLDMVALPRDVIPQTEDERIDTQRNQIGLYDELGRLPRELIEKFEVLDKKQIDALLAAKESDRLQAERLINRGGVNPAFDDEDDEDDDAA